MKRWDKQEWLLVAGMVLVGLVIVAQVWLLFAVRRQEEGIRQSATADRFDNVTIRQWERSGADASCMAMTSAVWD